MSLPLFVSRCNVKLCSSHDCHIQLLHDHYHQCSLDSRATCNTIHQAIVRKPQKGWPWLDDKAISLCFSDHYTQLTLWISLPVRGCSYIVMFDYNDREPFIVTMDVIVDAIKL